jgi:hypothetical protein
MEVFMGNKHLPRLFAQALNEKRVELFDEFIHPEYNNHNALDFYMEKIYPRHLNSFPLFGIEAHGFWTAKEDVEPRLFVLASYAASEDPGEVARRYMQSTEFADDIRNFNVSDIVGVESTILIPSTSSPLK